MIRQKYTTHRSTTREWTHRGHVTSGTPQHESQTRWHGEEVTPVTAHNTWQVNPQTRRTGELVLERGQEHNWFISPSE